MAETNEMLKRRTFYYVMDRRLAEGGFCFYRLKEPNASDTYYALSVLKILGFEPEDYNTTGYLLGLQDSDGSYESIPMTCYVLKSLLLLKKRPKKNPEKYISKKLDSALNSHGPGYSFMPVFSKLNYILEIYNLLGLEISSLKKDRLIEYILNYRRKDKGFGHNMSTLFETSQALQILSLLDYHHINDLEISDFVRTCEDPIFGFVGVPRTSLAFIEYLYAGCVASEILDKTPRYAEQSIKFIRACQKSNGGFSRSNSGGISTLEDTWYAINSILFLIS